MAKTWVVVVGHAPQTMRINKDDNVILAFCSNYKFCVTSNNAGDFNPALPTGQKFNAGDVWPTDGGVSVAQTPSTVDWDHKNHDQNCSSAQLGAGGHSIIISGS